MAGDYFYLPHPVDSLPVPPAPLKLRHYGTLQLFYYYYYYYYYDYDYYH